MDVNKQHLRQCMLFCFKLETNAAEAIEMIKLAWGENAIGYETVRKQFTKFRAKNFGLEDEERSGALRKVLDEEIHGLDKNRDLEGVRVSV